MRELHVQENGMIYDCPQCGAPQQAGQTICPQCHAEFDGPVPADAVVPVSEPAPAEAMPAAPDAPLAGAETAPEEAAAAEGAASGEVLTSLQAAPLPEDAQIGEAAPLLEDAPPSVAAEAPPLSGSAPYLTPPSYAPPPYSPSLASVTPLPYTPPPSSGGPPLGRLTRALLIAFPIVLVLVLGGVYLAGALNTESDVVPVTAPTVSAQALPLAPAAPVTLSGGGNTDDGADPHVKLLAGRWVSKSDDFYVFNPDGTGSRGSALNPSGDQPFLWGLVQNRLMLYGTKNETMRFNVGPDSDTVFLAPPSGHYVQYSRAKS